MFTISEQPGSELSRTMMETTTSSLNLPTARVEDSKASLIAEPPAQIATVIAEAYDFENVDWEHLSDSNARPLLAMEVKRLQRSQAALEEKLKTSEKELELARRHLSEMDHMDRDRVVSLVQALKEATCCSYENDYLKDEVKEATSVSPGKLLNGGKVMSSDHAIGVVVSSLVENLRVLGNKNEKLNADNLRLYEAAADLESTNEAHEYKIDVLESQFKSINKTRQKVVSRLSKASTRLTSS